MQKYCRMSMAGLATVILALMFFQHAGRAAEMRFALVIGNDEYKSAKLATPGNDAGLVADALSAAGFTVTGARNLDQATLRETLREFVGQVASAGADAVAVVYLAGLGVQFAGDNYFVPIDADLARDVDVPLQAVRVSDFAQPLAALPGRVKIVILDAARQNSFARGGEPLASGLALVDPGNSMAVAFNAAPGTVAPDEPGPYGAYASALTEMIAAGGLSLDDLFARVRLRVSELTAGGEVPWYAAQIDGPFFITERAADAPPPPNVMPLADFRSRAMRSYPSADDAYAAALALDTIEGYEQFLEAYPASPFSPRVAAMLAVRREEIIWRRCVFNNTPPAYWSYLRRYPNGPHVWDARRRLAMLGMAIDAPASFAVFDFGVPPPPPSELAFVGQPVLTFWRLGFPPPPPPPLIFLPPRPREFSALPPPPPPRERFSLPTPGAAVIPAFVRPPRTVLVRPSPAGAVPGRLPVALPGAVQASHGPGATNGPGARPAAPAAGASSGAPNPDHPETRKGPPPAPPTAAVKPAPLPPPPAGAAPATVKPAAPPPPPPAASVKPETPPPHPTGPAPAAIKPAPPPPAPPPPHPPAPATIKPAPPPPAPPPPRPPAPAAASPPPPPPHPAAPPPKPACPPGKTLAEVNGRPTCK